jgi:hypothetical protein
LRHKSRGPAVRGCGMNEWWVNGKLHRLNGPAIIWKYKKNRQNRKKEWWIDGKRINCKDNEEFLRIVKMKELL